jgi:dihydroorotase
MIYDLLLKDGILIDPAQGIHAGNDISFINGKVAAVDNNIPSSDSAEVINCSGRIVAPGMIDLHVHVFWGISHFGVEPDKHCVARGVTTALDVGSAGADTFLGFRKYVIERSMTRLFALLNISSQGMLTREIGELYNLKYANVSKAIRMIEQHRDVILGIKVRLIRHEVLGDNEETGILPLYLAREAADAVGLPIMVDAVEPYSDSIDPILTIMREGDILTHCFHGRDCGILDDNGNVRKSVLEAIERGVIFDVGHGRSSFTWDVAESAFRQKVYPQTISSDLHIYNTNGPVYDLVTTVNKFLFLGLSLDDALHRVTATPAKIFRMPEDIGSLKVGACGDAVVFELQEGNFEFSDSPGQVRIGRQRLVPITVVRAGKVYWHNESNS